MRRNHLIGDLFSTLFDRRLPFSRYTDTRDILTMSHALLSAEGEVSGQRLAATIMERYTGLDDDAKFAFFQDLNEDFELNLDRLTTLIDEYKANPTPKTYAEMKAASEPRRQELLRRLNQPIGATPALVAMRTDLLRAAKAHPELKRTDQDFMHLLRSWFNRGFLVLRLIDWDTPASILDKIVAYEAVHAINDYDDLRRRLLPEDRRCFAFFHPSMPDEPLIFVEVALTKEVPSSIQALLSDSRPPMTAEEATTAVFYSISNCQSGLAGISFGNLLIKQVVDELSRDFPNITRFVTISPIPGLNDWLRDQVADADAQSVLDGTAPDEVACQLAAHYLVNVKRTDGLPVDPVARFHLTNGAEIFALHARADTSVKGLDQSSGVMVNYLYDLGQTEKNHEDFATATQVATSKPVRNLSSTAQQARPKESSS